jgi:Carboxypeptidase regulatory-like domain/TonB dependent receptor-like, beta-barrel
MKGPVLVVIFLLTSVASFAQTEGARISGRVTDPTDAVIVGAECQITNIETNVSTSTITNEDGIYVLPDLRPATYRLTIQKEGFRTVVQPNLQLYVQDAVNENFTLAIGSVSENATVVDAAPMLLTDSAAVSTVVNQQFVENMPLNGRSFQSLIALTPGVVFVSADLSAGQFSVNGQRSNANYFMVDGVSANFGVSPLVQLSETMSGSTPGLTSSGGTNGLVSIDAMQEFRIQTSSYAPEFGRSPGAQISIVTKSGVNQFHGTAFDYLRNEIFDARNWFNNPPDVKPPLRQNDFGGTVGGPIIRDKTFFFFSYEGLRLRLPQTATGLFYTASARAGASPAYQPFVNALPVPPPNAPLSDPKCQTLADPTGCTARLTVGYSNPSALDATSIRVDHNLKNKVSLFARYNHAPSHDATRYWEEVLHDNANTDTFTAGATILLAPTKVNDFRANWSRNTGSVINYLTNFHGAVVPSLSVLFPSSTPYTFGTAQALVIFPDGNFDMEVRAGTSQANVERQLNFVDTFAWTVGVHQFKFGIDYRLINSTAGESNGWFAFDLAYTSIVAGKADIVAPSARDPISISMNNYSLFGQDTWRATHSLTLTYGLRWEINTPPESAMSGKPLYSTQGIFDSNPLAVVPGALWHTKFANFAPRVGAAYQVTPRTVVRGGFGLFYDLGYGNVGGATGFFPYDRKSFVSASTPFDLTNPTFQPPPFSTKIDANTLYVPAVNPNLKLPFTMQWNAAIEQQLGAKQTLTATYVGADARRLLRQDVIVPPLLVNLGTGGSVRVTRNGGYSHYNALQVQFQRRMSHGLQALVSYNFAKSSDLGSSDQSGAAAASVSQVVLPSLTPSAFDIRHSLAGAVSYEIPAPSPSLGRVSNAILQGWAVDGLLRVTSAWPINVTIGQVSPVFGRYVTQPDIVSGQPYWLAAPTQPGGKVMNPDAFTRPPDGQTGNFPVNGLRGEFSVNQTDLALRRRFNLSERIKLDIRAEYFNVFNHPMFGAPGSGGAPFTFWGYGNTPNPSFGLTTSMLGGGTTNYALGSGAVGGQSAQYAVGGPRSGQFTLKLLF